MWVRRGNYGLDSPPPNLSQPDHGFGSRAGEHAHGGWRLLLVPVEAQDVLAEQVEGVIAGDEEGQPEDDVHRIGRHQKQDDGGLSDQVGNGQLHCLAGAFPCIMPLKSSTVAPMVLTLERRTGR